MPKTAVLPDGTRLAFPDDATDAEMTEMVNRLQQGPPTTGGMFTELLGGPPGSTRRNVGRAAGAIAGGVGGGLLAGPPGAIGGAGLGAAGSEVLMNLLKEGRLPPLVQTGRVGVTGALGEGVGQGVVAGLRPLTRMLGLSRGLTPEMAQVARTAGREMIPLRASEITGRRGAAMLERFPERFPLGTNAPQKFSQQQSRQAERAVRSTLPRELQGARGEEVTGRKIAAGIAAQGDIKSAVQAFRRNAQVLFGRVERLAGDQPVVDVSGLKGTLAELTGQRASVIGPPSGVTRLSRTLGSAASPGEVSLGPSATGAGGGTLRLEDLPPAMRQFLQGGAERLSFRDARRVESELGQLAYRNRHIIGTMQEGQYKVLHREIRKAIDGYLMTPEGAEAAPALAEAKQAYRVGRSLFEDSINKRLLRGDAQKVVDTAFRPGDLTSVLDFREAVSPETWQTTKFAWLAGIIDKSMGRGETFSPARFSRFIQPYIKSGQIDTLFEPQIAQRLKGLSQVFGRMAQASTLAENPSGTAQAILGAEQVRAAARLPFEIGGGLLLGHPVAGMGVAASELVLPWAVAKFTLSPTGRRMLTVGMSGRYSAPALRAALQIMAQESGSALTGEQEGAAGR